MKTPLRALLVEDNPGDADMVRECLSRPGHSIDLAWAQTLAEALVKVREAAPDAIILDLNLPDSTGMATLGRILNAAPDAAVVVFTGTRDEELGVTATRHGAQDYLIKGHVAEDAVRRLLHMAVERKRIERDLRHSQQRLQLALDSMRMGVWDLDLVSETSIRNLLHDQIFGYQVPPSRWGLADFVNHVAAPAQTIVKDRIKRGIESGALKLECEIRRVDGSFRWIELEGQVFRDAKQAPRRLLAVIKDVTDRRQSERALEEARERFARAFNANPAAMMITSNATGTIVDCNESVLRLTGHTRQDIIGQPVDKLRLFTKEERNRMLSSLPNGSATGQHVVGHNAAGETREYWWLAQVVTMAGKPCLLEIFSDVTEVRRAQLQEQELQRVRQVEQFKSDFMRNMAHELHTPLTPARIQVHLLRTGALGDLSESQNHAMQVLDRNLFRLSQLTREMLDVSRLQSGHLPLRPVRTRISDLVLAAVEASSPILKMSELRCETDLDELLEADVDANRVEQVLLNLLSNAAKVSARSAIIGVRAFDAGDGIEIHVRDSGVGLTEAQMAQLFLPFSQVHPEAAIGVGLGLHISRGIVEAHGGRIWCESPGPGKGATFAFRIPKQRPAEGNPCSEHVSQALGGPAERARPAT